MKNKMSKFIVFEGIDGCGKSTQIDILTKTLNSKGIKTVATREPQRDRAVGRVLNSILKGNEEVDPQVTAMLFAADRIDHITYKNGINSMLRDGITVVCDRYYFSNFAYNNESIDIKQIETLNSSAMNICKPDVHIFIDTPVDIALSRLNKRNSKELYENYEKLNNVRNNYFKLFDKYKNDENIIIIDGQRPIIEISKLILNIYENL